MKKIIILLLFVSTVFGQWASWANRRSATTSNRPDYVYQSNFIATVGLDTTYWSSIGADIYGNNPSGKFSVYAPLVIPTFFDTVSYLESVTTSQIVIYAGKINARWDISVWDIDDATNVLDYNNDADALFLRMSPQPNAARKQLISDFIDSLQSNGTKNFWANADRIWVMAAHDSGASKLNWKADEDNLLTVNALTFTADRGWAGNGTSSYLNTQFIPSTDGVNFTQDAASIAIYIRTNAASSTLDYGAWATGAGRMVSLVSRNASNSWYGRINDFSDNTTVNADSRGLFGYVRTNATTRYKFRNGTAESNETVSSSGLPALNMYVCCRNLDGVPSLYTTREYSFLYIGGVLSTAESAVLYRIVEWYLDQIGAGVI